MLWKMCVWFLFFTKKKKKKKNVENVYNQNWQRWLCLEQNELHYDFSSVKYRPPPPSSSFLKRKFLICDRSSQRFNDWRRLIIGKYEWNVCEKQKTKSYSAYNAGCDLLPSKYHQIQEKQREREREKKPAATKTILIIIHATASSCKINDMRNA